MNKSERKIFKGMVKPRKINRAKRCFEEWEKMCTYRKQKYEEFMRLYK